MVIPGKNAFKEGNLCSNCKTRQMLKTRSLACPNTSVYCCHLQAAPTTGRSVRNQQAENCVGNKALGWGCSRLAPHCAHHHRQLLGWGGGDAWAGVLCSGNGAGAPRGTSSGTGCSYSGITASPKALTPGWGGEFSLGLSLPCVGVQGQASPWVLDVMS